MSRKTWAESLIIRPWLGYRKEMAIRTAHLCAFAVLLLAGCGDPESGPLRVDAIGGEADLVNPNLQELDPASAFLAEAVAQGLVRFDAAGEIEPALAQSWIVSDDGQRYTFRLQRTEWNGGGRVTAEQVAQRLRAAISGASRNPLKPMLEVVDEIEAMTDQVLEISLKAPRPNFLQLLAQPQLAIIHDGRGTGPYRIAEVMEQGLLLAEPEPDEEEELEEEEEVQGPSILLRGDRAALAVARFLAGESDLVIGGTAGDLPIVRAAAPASDALSFDPVAGMFGLAFTSEEGFLADPSARRALSMAVDRQAIVSALNVNGLEPRTSIVPPGIDELPEPSPADWTGAPMAMRRELAAQAIEDLEEEETPRIRVAMPEGPGYRLIFAYLRRDWHAIGVEAERVAPDAQADLRFIDEVAPVNLATWYFHRFTCAQSSVCDETVDQLLTAAQIVPGARDRQLLLDRAEQLLGTITPFIPIAAPVRWSLRSPRATGFRANVFARHPAGELIAETP